MKTIIRKPYLLFENSLNEIESVNAEIEGADYDKQKSKPKKDGVFYTPKYITKYIVENTTFKKGVQPYKVGKGIPVQTREFINARIYHSEERIVFREYWGA